MRSRIMSGLPTHLVQELNVVTVLVLPVHSEHILKYVGFKHKIDIHLSDAVGLLQQRSISCSDKANNVFLIENGIEPFMSPLFPSY